MCVLRVIWIYSARRRHLELEAARNNKSTAKCPGARVDRAKEFEDRIPAHGYLGSEEASLCLAGLCFFLFLLLFRLLRSFIARALSARVGMGRLENE